MQGLGQNPRPIVLDRPEQRTFQVLLVPGGLQIGGNKPLRQDMQRQIADLVSFPFHTDMQHPFSVVDWSPLLCMPQPIHNEFSAFTEPRRHRRRMCLCKKIVRE